MHVFDNNGIELKAECSIGEEDGVYGLILESWGPGDRNKDYNIALDYIIERLVDSGVSQVENICILWMKEKSILVNILL